MKRLRAAGARWRILVHEPHARTFHVSSNPRESGDNVTVLPGTEFDELVVGKGAIHIEQMASGLWWMSIGGVHIDIRIDRDGRPVSVFSEGVVDPQPGCFYDLTGDWT